MTSCAIQGAPLAPARGGQPRVSRDKFEDSWPTSLCRCLLHSSLGFRLGDEQSAHASAGAAAERVAELKALEAIAACVARPVPLRILECS